MSVYEQCSESNDTFISCQLMSHHLYRYR